MSELNEHDFEKIAVRLKRQALEDAIRITAHAHQEMAEEDISLEEILDVLLSARIVENYPQHRRGACALVCQRTHRGRWVHVVCTTSLEVAVVITVYEPRPPKWVTPLERGAVR